MKALTWHGTKDVRVENKPEPKIMHSRDAIVKITRSAICGSDLHIYHGFVSSMKSGDILGHEFAGEIIELGSEVRNLKIGDRVVIPFTISCGDCEACVRQQFALCLVSNPNKKDAAKLLGYPTAGLFGYSHLYGGFPGGQAQYVRVPFADFGALVLPPSVSEEKALFISDIFSTGYMAAENCMIEPEYTVAIWGCGPVGQFAIRSAFLLKAKKVIAIDRFSERLALAKDSGAEIINYEKENVINKLKELTDGKGPDACIDAVGLEAHGHALDAHLDNVLQSLRLELDRTHVLREIIQACRPGGTVSILGVYLGFVNNFPMGIAFGKGLTFKMGQTHVQKYTSKLLTLIEENKIDPCCVITHKVGLEDAPEAYRMFSLKEDKCIKVVLSVA